MTAESPPLAAQQGPSFEEFLGTEWADADSCEGLLEVLRSVGRAARYTHRYVRLAALASVLGSTGTVNVQGEVVQRLDALGADLFVNALKRNPRVAGLACEELGEMVPASSGPDATYLAVFDPIDGSSNIDVAVSIGSIFGFYRRESGGPLTEAEFLRPGRELVGAAYIVYGSSTVFVAGTAAGVHGFTLDTTGEFVLTHPSMRIPDECPYYSVNEGNYKRWDPAMQRAIEALRNSYSSRYVGSLVADFHRNLLKGGVFLYPADQKSPEGKLRLLYEANPLSFIAEQAGGASSSGTQRILDVEPRALHQRTPLIVGNAEAVRQVEAALSAVGTA